MKRLICVTACICLLMIGCSKPDPVETQAPTGSFVPETTAEAIADVPAQETMYAVSVPTISENTRADDGTIIFSYTHQNMMLTLPEQDVADKVIIDFLTRVDASSASVGTLCESAKANYTGADDWTPYLYNITYSPMRMDQGVLSLFGNCITYTGASHPERLSMSANYDLVTGDVLTLGSIMSAHATTGDFCQLVLEKLSQCKEEKYLYEDYETTVKQRFSKDESQDEDWYFSTNGLCFYFVPYEIAPYSSGVIIAEIPYNELSGLLYDGYFPAERESAAGDVKAVKLESTEVSQFTQIAELELDPDGQMVFLYTDGIVWDVKIEYGAWDTANQSFTSVYTALLSCSLTPGDAIMIQTKEPTALRITYSNGTQTVTKHFNQSGNNIQLAS